MFSAVYAQLNVGPEGGFTLPGPLGSIGTNPGGAGVVLEDVISTVIGVLTIIAFIWFVIQFFIAAIQIISSGGDKAALSAARGKLTTSIIGVVVVISAIFIIELVGSILGISILTGINDFLFQ